MKRLHITAEGQTEEMFVNDTLMYHLANYEVFSDVRCVLTSRNGSILYRGGMTTYKKAKDDITRWLNEERNNKDVAFTTMFDYYALPNDFPGLIESSTIIDPYERVLKIEEELFKDIDDKRFIPYIQLHEFEALLFTDPQKFDVEFFENPQGIADLQAIAETYNNPELINNGVETAPSKRIIKVFPSYADNKPAIGSMIAQDIGIDALKKSCKHFREWVTKLEGLDDKKRN